MIDLTGENRISVPTMGFEDALYIFPSFLDLSAAIVRMQKRKIEIKGSDVRNRENEERLIFFNHNVLRTENLPARKDDELVELSTLEDWIKKVPAPTKIAAAAVFDQAACRILEPEVFGDPVTIEVDAVVGKALFHFPELANMTDDLTFLTRDRLRQKGRRVKDRSHDVRMEFWRRAKVSVEGVMGYGEAPGSIIDQTPVNWVVGMCSAFESEQALSEDELGN